MQRNVKRVTLSHVPLDVVFSVMDSFKHVEELKCEDIKPPQQVCLYILAECLPFGWDPSISFEI